MICLIFELGAGIVKILFYFPNLVYASIGIAAKSCKKVISKNSPKGTFSVVFFITTLIAMLLAPNKLEENNKK